MSFRKDNEGDLRYEEFSTVLHCSELLYFDMMRRNSKNFSLSFKGNLKINL